MNGIVYLVGTVVIITAAPPSSARARALPEVTENASLRLYGQDLAGSNFEANVVASSRIHTLESI